VVPYGGAAGGRFTLTEAPHVHAGLRADSSSQVITTMHGKLSVTLPLLGGHNAVNALGAIAVGAEMGVPPEDMAAALAGATPVEMRLNVRRIGSGAGAVTLMNDAYNANPSSVRRAVETLRQFPLSADGRRVAILGDMFELGDHAPDLHRQVGRWIAELGAGDDPMIHLAILIGQLSLFTAEALSKLWPPEGGAERVKAFPMWDDSLPGRVAGLLRGGDVVLIKASRGMRLERLVPAIEEKFGREETAASRGAE
jgi:UDP-N-acetylmuramoyl-tripeptide--D-alanyl-D-alanine ligase